MHRLGILLVGLALMGCGVAPAVGDGGRDGLSAAPAFIEQVVGEERPHLVLDGAS